VNIVGTSASLYSPSSVAVDTTGNVFFADQNAVLRLDATLGVMTLVAGNGTAGSSGDNGPAASAQLSASGVAVDSVGNLYVADADNNRIRKVSNGVITTVAGNGTEGFSGDNGLATDAQLDAPQGVAVDSAGNLYIVVSDGRIRKVASGVITTVAGNGFSGFSGDNGPATNAQLSASGVAVDTAGNLYIADRFNSRIRKVSNGVIITVAGNGTHGFSGDNGPAASAELNDPVGVAVDSAGNVYIADAGGSRIRKISGGVIATVAGNGTEGFGGDNGPATSAQLNEPYGVAVDYAGNIYVADLENSRIRRVSNGVITTAAGNGTQGFSGDNGPATSAQLGLESGLAMDSADNLYIADSYNHRIRKVSSGVITTAAGNGASGFSGDNGPAISAQLASPGGIAVDSLGNLYIADTGNNRVRKVSGGVITTVAGNGTSGFSGDNGPATSAQLAGPEGIAVDSLGNLYIADTGNNRVRTVSNGVITTVAGNGTYGFSGDNGPAASAQLAYPAGVAVDSAFNLYIADSENNRVRNVSSGLITTVAGNGTYGFSGDNGPATSAQLDFPYDVAVDSAGKLYIADRFNYRVRKISSGAITSIAGSGTRGFSGDNGPATSAEFTDPMSVAVDSARNVYVADSNVIRMLHPDAIETGPQTISFASLPTVTIGIAPFAIGAIASSGLPVSFASTTPAVCTVAGSIVTVVAVGACSITASQPGNSIYFAATPVTQIFTVSTQVAQTITFGALSSQILGTAPFSISATTSSGLVVTFTSSTLSVCTISGSTVTVLAVGSCSIAANQAGDANYLPARAVTQTFTVGAACVTPNNDIPWFDSVNYISQPNAAGDLLLVGAMSLPRYFNLSSLPLPRFSGDRFCGRITLAPGYSVEAYIPTAAERAGAFPAFSGLLLDPATARPGPNGSTVMDPFPGGTIPPSRLPSPFAWRVISALLSQTVTFGALADQILSVPPFTINAVASSGLAVSLTSMTTAVCAVSGSTVTLVAAGTCSITASQAGNSNYAAATPLTQSFTVSASSQTITFGALSNMVFGAAPFTVGATVSSGLAVAFASTTTAVCTVSGSTVTVVAAGTCTITASQSGNANYNAATSVPRSFAVSQASQTITFGALSGVTLGVMPVGIAATASSGLAVSLASTTTSICTVSSAAVTIIAAGTCSITASQAGNANYAPAIPVTQAFTVTTGSGPQTITFDPIPNQIFGISPFPIAARASSRLAIGIVSTTPTVCKTASGRVMLLGAGTCSVTASQGGNASYGAAAPVTRSFSVSLANPSGSFQGAASIQLPAGTYAESVTVGDFNGDGIQDLATANYTSHNVTVLLGNGSGGFTEATGSPFTVGGLPYSVVAGDFNGDGIQDLATANYSSNNVTVLLGNGAGGFTGATGSPFAVGMNPWYLVVGDVNGDGIQDLAVANVGSYNVTVLLGNGTGGFTAAAASPFASGPGAPQSVAFGDFDGDGIEDLAVTSSLPSNLAVVLGNGSGGFTAATGSPFTVGTEPESVAVGDFNRDGIEDLAIANRSSHDVTVLLGNGSGGFTAAVGSPFAVGNDPMSLVAGDFNGDGIQDLATANSTSHNITVLLGNGSGTFMEATGSPFAVGIGPSSIVVGDFNGDGIQDLATANSSSGNLTVLLGFAVGHTSQTITFGDGEFGSRSESCRDYVWCLHGSWEYSHCR
jgi:hypothetical protein